ncbi:hypothetical protein H7I76_31070 [Mycolicibacterium vaccae]|nr:hypothetical protein [Mycolicibacterium vaccae]
MSSNDHNGLWRILLFWPEDANGISGLELEAFGRANDSFVQRGAQVTRCRCRYEVHPLLRAGP